MGASVFEVFQSAIIDSVERQIQNKGAQKSGPDQPSGDDDEPPTDTRGDSADEEVKPVQGKLILDATVAPQAIRYPTDLSLLKRGTSIHRTDH